MKRSQIILAVSALLLAGLLFMLPKGIVSKDEQGDLAKAANTANRDGQPASAGHLAAEGTEADVHTTANPAAQEAIASLRNQLAAAATDQQKLTLTDSLAGAYKAAGRYDSAGYYYEQVAQSRPTEKSYLKAADQYFQAFSFAANEQRAAQLSQKTRQLYEKVLKHNPGNLSAKSNLAMTYVASENPMQGITMLREVLQQDPNNENALYQMGILSIQSGQHAKAVDRFRKLVEVNPKHLNGNFYLGVSLAESGQKQEAIEVFRRVETMSDDPALHASVHEYLEKLGEKAH